MDIEKVNDLQLLIAVIIGEAAGESIVGKMAVACVIRNRKHDLSRWHDTWREVILQKKQFSCFNHLPRSGSIPTTLIHRYFMTQFSELWWRECRIAAWGVLYNFHKDITNGANHYYAPALVDEPPYWVFIGGYEAEPCFEVGAHSFYNL